jgi:hypothetical protein
MDSIWFAQIIWTSPITFFLALAIVYFSFFFNIRDFLFSSFYRKLLGFFSYIVHWFNDDPALPNLIKEQTANWEGERRLNALLSLVACNFAFVVTMLSFCFHFQVKIFN